MPLLASVSEGIGGSNTLMTLSWGLRPCLVMASAGFPTHQSQSRVLTFA